MQSSDLNSIDKNISKNRAGRLIDKSLRWLVFCFGLMIIWFFMFMLLPWLQGMPSVHAVIKHLKESNIDAGALFYTEVEEVANAEMSIHNMLSFTPCGPLVKRNNAEGMKEK